MDGPPVSGKQGGGTVLSQLQGLRRVTVLPKFTQFPRGSGCFSYVYLSPSLCCFLENSLPEQPRELCGVLPASPSPPCRFWSPAFTYSLTSVGFSLSPPSFLELKSQSGPSV